MTVVILEKTDEGLTSEQRLRTLSQKTGKKHLGGWLLQREHPPRVGTSASPPNPPKLSVVILDQKAGMEGTSAKSSRAGNWPQCLVKGFRKLALPQDSGSPNASWSTRSLVKKG